MQVLNISNPATVYIQFKDVPPRTFILRNEKNEIYFVRHLNGKTPRIKFNIPHADRYYGNAPFEVCKIVPIEIKETSIVLPPFERDRIKDFTIVYNPDLHGTPARVFTNEGVIEKGRSLYQFPKPMRVFFLLHEIGHFYYKTEQYCDLFAFVHFIRMGYNVSTAMYCLTKVLKDNSLKEQRVKFIHDKLKSNGLAS